MKKEEQDDSLSAAVRLAIRKIGSYGTENGLRQTSLCKVFITEVRPENANELIRTLSSVLPLCDGLSHLKRVRRVPCESSEKGFRLDMVLCREETWLLRDAEVKEQMSRFQLEPRLVNVPAAAPLSKEELKIWGEIWPLIYKPGKDQHIPLTPSELRRMYVHANYVQEKSMKSDPCNQAVAAILVHPGSDMIASEGIDSSERLSPCQSAASPTNACLSHAVMNCVTSFAIPHVERANKRKQGPASSSAGIGDKNNSPLPLDQYLCTGLDCYVTREPCVMCTMALVHSRIRRIIFVSYNNDEVGGLSEAKIHCEAALNHRCEAFFLPLSEVKVPSK